MEGGKASGNGAIFMVVTDHNLFGICRWFSQYILSFSTSPVKESEILK